MVGDFIFVISIPSEGIFLRTGSKLPYALEALISQRSEVSELCVMRLIWKNRDCSLLNFLEEIILTLQAFFGGHQSVV